MQKVRAVDRASRGYAELARVQDTLQWGAYWLDSVTEQMPVNFQLLSGKGSYVFSVLFRLVMKIGIVIAGAAGIAWLFSIPGFGREAGFVRPILLHPLFLAITGLLTLQAMRRIAFRLGDSDPNK